MVSGAQARSRYQGRDPAYGVIISMPVRSIVQTLSTKMSVQCCRVSLPKVDEKRLLSTAYIRSGAESPQEGRQNIPAAPVLILSDGRSFLLRAERRRDQQNNSTIINKREIYSRFLGPTLSPTVRHGCPGHAANCAGRIRVFYAPGRRRGTPALTASPR